MTGFGNDAELVIPARAELAGQVWRVARADQTLSISFTAPSGSTRQRPHRCSWLRWPVLLDINAWIASAGTNRSAICGYWASGGRWLRHQGFTHGAFRSPESPLTARDFGRCRHVGTEARDERP